MVPVLYPLASTRLCGSAEHLHLMCNLTYMLYMYDDPRFGRIGANKPPSCSLQRWLPPYNSYDKRVSLPAAFLGELC